MSTQQCPVCQSGSTQTHGDYRANSEELSQKERHICTDCGLIFMAPLPSEAEWTAYNSSYFERAHGNMTDHPRAGAFRTGLAKVRAHWVASRLESAKIEVSRVLEIGPGHGEFADAWTSLNPDIRYYGQETDSSVHEKLKAKGVTLFEKLDEVPDPVNLVVISHVLEHTLNPAQFLSDALGALRPGGAVFIEVPCRDCDYKNIDEPHTLFFDKPPMSELFERLPADIEELAWIGETHDALIADRDKSRLAQLIARLRQRVKGLFVNARGIDGNVSSAEWSVLHSFKPHIEQSAPARWLRVLAIKSVD